MMTIVGKGAEYGVVINITNEVLKEVNGVRYICESEFR